MAPWQNPLTVRTAHLRQKHKLPDKKWLWLLLVLFLVVVVMVVVVVVVVVVHVIVVVVAIVVVIVFAFVVVVDPPQETSTLKQTYCKQNLYALVAL